MTTGKAKVIGSFEPLEGDDLIRANELKRREGRHSIQESILKLQAETGKNFALHKAVSAGTIKSYAPGDDKDPIVCEPHQRDLREEIYWDDVIKWIAIEFPRFKYPVTPIPAAPVVTAGAPGGVEPATPATVGGETVEQRRFRYLVMFETEQGRGKRGALQRVANREGVDRSNMMKDINKAKAIRTEQKRAGLFVSHTVKDGKRKL